ncbi:hypothetical protein L3i22_021180 [Actinoplanes sp. L3-i22]|nr:hypothetical protein L3i22_021180 [Actinoplanes sp. L3-i22]
MQFLKELPVNMQAAPQSTTTNHPAPPRPGARPHTCHPPRPGARPRAVRWAPRCRPRRPPAVLAVRDGPGGRPHFVRARTRLSTTNVAGRAANAANGADVPPNTSQRVVQRGPTRRRIGACVFAPGTWCVAGQVPNASRVLVCMVSTADLRRWPTRIGEGSAIPVAGRGGPGGASAADRVGEACRAMSCAYPGLWGGPRPGPGGGPASASYGRVQVGLCMADIAGRRPSVGSRP